ncbi:two-component system response regulator [Lyngbya confervoides]|uniref:EAL domain-containing protein n=1 Tax=Lyngbya confervoides BDU141951 TaxID=1574623 RepID=A0ABD4T5L6_9CYAN|nr:EAL domain-containing protein [Lyngbya confervoides]MCM1983926.1 EAL domain-containing protein [Lyngbya confervoides BDU141951]
MPPSYAALILIVDDNPTNLEVMSETLSDAGYEVAIATSGKRAIQQVQRRQPDLMLLDVMMPGCDGFQTCQIIRQDLGLKNIPIIFMTALADTGSKIKGLELGAVDYIAKPFHEQEVLARVNVHLQLKQTEQKLRRSEARLESILNSLEEVVWSVTVDPLQFLYINPAIEPISGYPAAHFMANPQLWFNMVHPEDRCTVQQAFESLTQTPAIELEYRILTQQGSTRWLRVRAQHIHDHTLEEAAREKPNQLRIDGILYDVSDRKEIETQLIHEAHHDSLTGLINRNCFIDTLTQRLVQSRIEPGSSFAVLFIDLDRFKSINDSLGHHLGDQLLQKVAERLQQSLRPADIIARLGGDEFTVLLDRVNHTNDAISVAERINQRLAIPFQIEGQLLFTTASIGIVMATPHYACAEELLRDADIAMYQSKKRGKASWQLFDPSMYESSLRQLELERDLRLSLENQDFSLYYQPIIHLETGRFLGFEALVRWIHPRRGFVSPAEFIPIAEESGLIEPLGDQILWTACRQIKQWLTQFPHLVDLSVSVNLSSKQLQNAKFVETLDRALTTTGISGQYLKLEITESILMGNHESLTSLFRSLLKRQVTLSLDDFGTGYSSLSYLHRFPLNEIKIDRSFINRIETDQQSREIVKIITTLAKTLNMTTVAEGVETLEQAEYLRSMACDMVQGYYFSQPLPEAEATAWIMNHAATLTIMA